MKSLSLALRVTLALSLGGCFAAVGDNTQDTVTERSGISGLFFESSDVPDAGNLAEPPDQGFGLGDRCIEPTFDEEGEVARTPATLNVEFTTSDIVVVPADVDYGPDNAGAAWLERLDPADPAAGVDLIGHFVDNLEVWADERAGALNWNRHGCKAARVDTLSSASLRDHGNHSLVWDGKDFMGNVAPDGDYALWLEVSESQYVPSSLVKVPFTKGPAGFELTPAGVEGLGDIRITYTPSPSASE